MARAIKPEFKVYDASGRYQAACKEPEAAAALIDFYGDGATVRWRHHTVVWREGSEFTEAGESYDHAAERMLGRVREAKISADGAST